MPPRKCSVILSAALNFQCLVIEPQQHVAASPHDIPAPPAFLRISSDTPRPRDPLRVLNLREVQSRHGIDEQIRAAYGGIAFEFTHLAENFSDFRDYPGHPLER